MGLFGAFSLKKPVVIWCVRCDPPVFVGKLRHFETDARAANPQEGLQGTFRNENGIGLSWFITNHLSRLPAFHDDNNVDGMGLTASVARPSRSAITSLATLTND